MTAKKDRTAAVTDLKYGVAFCDLVVECGDVLGLVDVILDA